jgi:hypothetical protein
MFRESSEPIDQKRIEANCTPEKIRGFIYRTKKGSRLPWINWKKKKLIAPLAQRLLAKNK